MNDKAVFGLLKTPTVCVLMHLVETVVTMNQNVKRKAQEKHLSVWILQCFPVP